MVGSMRPPEGAELDTFALKCKSLGLDSRAALQSLLALVRVRYIVGRGNNIVETHRVSRHLTVLLSGVACLHERLEDGSRQIYAFQYGGDFCDLHRYVVPEMTPTTSTAALTDCSIGIIRHDDLDRLLSKYPKLNLLFWRASMLEASIFRQRLLNVSRQAALPRIANIICEQMARLAVINIKSPRIPISQVDLADAAGLSVVHVNRVIRELRQLGALARKRSIEVANADRLAQLARFDQGYLNMRHLLTDWTIEIE